MVFSDRRYFILLSEKGFHVRYKDFLSAKESFCPRKGRFVHRENAKLFAQISGTIFIIHIVLTETKCEMEGEII